MKHHFFQENKNQPRRQQYHSIQMEGRDPLLDNKLTFENKLNYQVPPKNKEIKLAIREPQNNLVERLREIKRATYPGRYSIAVKPLTHVASKGDALSLLTVGSLITGIVFTTQEMLTLRHDGLEAKNDYNHMPQGLLNNQTCAESTNSTLYTLCRGAEESEDFNMACNGLIGSICDLDNGLALGVTVMAVIVITLLFYTLRQKYNLLKENKNNGWLHLSDADKSFLLEHKVFSNIEKPITLNEIRDQIDQVILREVDRLSAPSIDSEKISEVIHEDIGEENVKTLKR